MNKKIIFSTLIAFVISIGFLNGSLSNSELDSNLTQVGVACVAYGVSSENGAVTALGGISIGTGVGVGYTAFCTTTLANCWNPVGWGCLAAGLVL
jgi:hypothetical protein